MKTYEAGNEWHYLNERHAIQQGGYDWRYLFGFNFHRLTGAEKRRYLYVYRQTCLARGIAETHIRYTIDRMQF